jgi:hypothetical protein
LPECFDALTTALETRPDDELTLQLIRSKLIDQAAKEYADMEIKKEIAMKVGQKKSSDVECFYCHKTGHVKKYCRKYLADKEEEKSESGNENWRAHAAMNTGNNKQYTFMMTGGSTFLDNKGWIVDSGSTSHMCCDRDQFVEMREKRDNVSVANGRETQVKGIGTVLLKTLDEKGNAVDVKLTNVLYVPELKVSLLSVSCLILKNVNVMFGKFECKLTFNGKTLGVATQLNNLFYLKVAKERAFHVRETETMSEIFKFEEENVQEEPQAILKIPQFEIRKLEISENDDESEFGGSIVEGKSLKNRIELNLDYGEPGNISAIQCEEKKMDRFGNAEILAGKNVQIQVKSKKKKSEGPKEIWSQQKPKKIDIEYDVDADLLKIRLVKYSAGQSATLANPLRVKNIQEIDGLAGFNKICIEEECWNNAIQNY